MAAPTKKINLSGLARKLVLDGLIDEEKAQKTFEESLKKKKPFVSLVVENNLVPSSSIALAAAQEFGAPLVDINLLEIDPDIIKLVKEDIIRKHHALPIFKRGKRLAVAVSDPTNIQALDEIKFATGLTTDAIIVEEDKLTKIIEKAMEDADGGLGDMDDDDFEDLDDLEVAEEGAQEQDDSDVDDAPAPRQATRPHRRPATPAARRRSSAACRSARAGCGPGTRSGKPHPPPAQRAAS